MLAGVVSVPPEFFFNIPVHWYIYLSCNGAELKEKKELLHGSSPPNFKGDLKISDQNNCVGGGDLSKKLNLTGEANFKRAPKILGGVYEPQWCHGCCFKGYSFMFVKFWVHIHSLDCWYYIQDVSNVLLPPTCCLSCLPVCQSNFNGWFRSQGKHRAMLEFKSSGCAVNNNLIYDSSLSLSVSVKVIPKFLILVLLCQTDLLGGNKWNYFKAMC